MHGKTWLLLAMILLLAIGMGCGGGGSSSGGGGSDTIVGTWNRVSSTGTGANMPEQLIFNSNGTGSYSGSATGSGTLTWTQQGSQLTITIQGVGTITVNNMSSPVGNTFTLGLYSGGTLTGTATYNRA